MTIEKNIKNKAKDLQRQLKEALPRLEPAEKAEAEAKIKYLDQILEEEDHDNRLREPKVFVSYADQRGDQLLKAVMRKISQLTTDTGENFKVLSGMGKHGDPEVMKHIVKTMKRCCIFVGILTSEYHLHSRKRKTDGSSIKRNFGVAEQNSSSLENADGKPPLGELTVTKQNVVKAESDVRLGIPGTWVILEAGMAQSLGLRVVLFVENEIHSDFWFKTMGGWRQAHFTRDKPEIYIDFLTNLIQEHYRRLRGE